MQTPTKDDTDTIKDVYAAIKSLLALQTSVKFQLGDLLIWLRQASPIAYNNVCKLLDSNPRDDLVFVAKDTAFRHDGLFWEHHAEVFRLPLAQRKRWLNRAHANHWTPTQLRKAIRAASKTVKRTQSKLVPIKPAANAALKLDRDARQGKADKQRAQSVFESVFGVN